MLTLDGIAEVMPDAAFSPDGSEIASTGANNNVVLWSVKTGAVLQMLAGHDFYVSHVVWLGSDRLISNDWSGIVRTWTRDGGTFRESATRRWPASRSGSRLRPTSRRRSSAASIRTGSRASFSTTRSDDSALVLISHRRHS